MRIESPGRIVARSSTSIAASPDEKLIENAAPSTAASCSSNDVRVGFTDRE